MGQELKIEKSRGEIAAEIKLKLERLGAIIGQSHHPETHPVRKAEVIGEMGNLLQEIRQMIEELEK